MKAIVCLAFALSAVLASPAPAKRVIYMEDPNNGNLEMVDLDADVPTTLAVSESDVTFFLYTLTNPNTPIPVRNVAQLNGSPYDPRKTTLVVAHGWKNDINSALNSYVREATFGYYDYNIFVVDWNRPASAIYASASGAVVPVGRIVGNFINSLQRAYQLTGSSFILIGHSLGAHVVGNAGAVVNSKVDTIVGLDPAWPLFSISNTDNRLDPTDGNFVQVIHTNGGLLGFEASIGHADYFPNGGKSQPGCGIDVSGSCAHSRAYQYFAESITRGDVFLSSSCASWTDFQQRRCSNNPISTMGRLNVDFRARGDFYLSTSRSDPFGTAEAGLTYTRQ